VRVRANIAACSASYTASSTAVRVDLCSFSDKSVAGLNRFSFPGAAWIVDCEIETEL
jgi:hypothetical protein